MVTKIMKKAKTYTKIDIFLDPFPHTGGHTAMECLIYGGPYVSMSKKVLHCPKTFRKFS